MQKYALLSVFDKTGIAEFAKELVLLGFSIISTGGTAKILEKHNIPFIPIQNITGNPESFDGRMKTISFKVESGILFDRSKVKHQQEAKQLGIYPIDIVVCNLYPFEQTIKKEDIVLEEAIEYIDVGGPTMIRSAAKNFKDVLVITDPKEYQTILDMLKKNAITFMLRKQLAAKAFTHLSFYDSQIAIYLKEDFFSHEITIPGRKLFDLRYGENPHQKGSVYIRPNVPSSLQHLEKKWGRDLSLINVTDINAGIETVRLFEKKAAVVIKHNSPSGIALGENVEEALIRAIQADPESAFGGIIIVNTAIDSNAAKVISEFKDKKQGNIDIVACPSISNEALVFLQKVRKTMGIYTFGAIPKKPDPFNIKWVDGGFIVQTADIIDDSEFKNWKVVTKKKPTEKQYEQMQIAWKFITRIKSNSVIVVDQNIPMTRGIGSGQTSRIRSTKLALEQAGEHCHDAILASDSFFPFGDSVQEAAAKGIAAIVQQGGSINDKASIDEANKANITMIFTGKRAFWH
jgi:phosphoribosylaminoimidazolecarboxamide formyltransferase/IMP cyclohydrolase